MKEFIRYMESKNHSASTQKSYLRCVKLFLKWVQKEDLQITKPDILSYLEFLKERKGQQNATRQNNLHALNHYFTHLYKSERISDNPCLFLKVRGTKVKKLHNLYTGEELNELYDNFYHVYIRNFKTCKYFGSGTVEYMQLTRARNYVAIGIMIYQGTIAGELKNIRLEDIDLQKGTIKLHSNRRAKERVLPLNAAQVGALINYIHNVKPKLEMIYKTAEYEDFLFSVENQNFHDVTGYMQKQLKAIDRKFKHFYQIRTSVITNWLKAYGLRKTQYLAGHRSIGTTERYTSNDLQPLIDDINNLHPFNL